jgi:hypothetical protein
MKNTTRLFLISVLLSVTALFFAYGTETLWLGVIVALGLGFFGWFGQHSQTWSWSIHLFLNGSVTLVIIGALLGLQLYFLLPAVLAALAAWDLARFQQRIKETQSTENVQEIEKRHLRLLALVLGNGGILASIVLTTRLQIGFGVTLVLGVILIISFGQMYRMVNN